MTEGNAQLTKGNVTAGNATPQLSSALPLVAEGNAPPMLRTLQNILYKATNKWLFQLRGAESGEVFLNQRRVFIIPTKAGLGFGAMLLTLFIGSVNYTLSLGFALTFLLAA